MVHKTRSRLEHLGADITFLEENACFSSNVALTGTIMATMLQKSFGPRLSTMVTNETRATFSVMTLLTTIQHFPCTENKKSVKHKNQKFPQ